MSFRDVKSLIGHECFLCLQSADEELPMRGAGLLGRG